MLHLIEGLKEPYRLGTQDISPDQSSLEFGIKWSGFAQDLHEERRILPRPYQVKPGGLGDY